MIMITAILIRAKMEHPVSKRNQIITAIVLKDGRVRTAANQGLCVIAHHVMMVSDDLVVYKCIKM